MTESARSALRSVVIAAAVAVTAASGFAIRAEDWPIYVVFVLFSLMLHMPAVEVLPQMPIPVAYLAMTIGFLYIGGPPIILLQVTTPFLVAVLPGRVRARWTLRTFGVAGDLQATPATLAANWANFTLGLGVRWWVVSLLVSDGNVTAHPGVILLAELVAYASGGLLSTLPIYSFRPLPSLRPDARTRAVYGDMFVIVILTLTPFVFLIAYGYQTHGLAGASVWSLAALGPHFVLKRLNDRRLRVEEQNRRLEDLQRELAHRERLSAIGKMSSVVSHQILQQLGVIGLYADLIRNASDDGEPQAELERSRRNAAAIEDALASVNGVLRDLLVFSRDRRLNLYDHPLGVVVDEALESCRGAAGEHGVTLRAHAAPDQLLPLDKIKIRQALANVVRNAIESSPAGGVVDVFASAADGVVEIAVTDQGPGVPIGQHDTVFAPFYTTKEHGTGLGLAIAREFVRAHGGDLTVADGSGPGATFVFRLPTAPKEPG
jgi:signal transduction histidine kinase